MPEPAPLPEIAEHGVEDVHVTWGLKGLQAALPHADVVVIVDVLSFTTTVDVALARGVAVHPWRWRDDSAREQADALGAALAEPRGADGYTLSPCSFLDAAAGTRVVLPSPNGSTLAKATGEVPTFAACLRNASAVARAAQAVGRRVTVVAAGELWPDRSLRPALEDLYGAGAVVAALEGTRTPEARAAEEAWRTAAADVEARLLACASGRELVEGDFANDVVLAAEHDVSDLAPRLVDGAFVA